MTRTALRPPVLFGRAWRLLAQRFGGRVISVVRSRRLASGLTLRDAVAAVAKDTRYTGRTSRCPECGGYLGDYGNCVTIGCSYDFREL